MASPAPLLEPIPADPRRVGREGGRRLRIAVPHGHLAGGGDVLAAPDLSLHLPEWRHVDHPGMVMTDVHKPTLVLLRRDPPDGRGRLEVDPHAYRTGSRTLPARAPPPAQP
ncbi:hypothetical protein [Streptomyces sp. NPDC059092]|uniref:hypothetical protein n=1 Tax=Streptomyces sp. NPDC059092 TaxID=3346725 RepID=UPI0036C4B07F